MIAYNYMNKAEQILYFCFCLLHNEEIKNKNIAAFMIYEDDYICDI